MYTDCYYDDIDCNAFNNDLDLNDDYTEEEIEEMRRNAIEQEFNAPLSMDSLGLSWKDF